MKPPSQQGYVLITVIIMLFVVAATAYMVSFDTSFQSNQSSGEIEAARADYVAEAAMQHALWQNGNNACVGDFTIPATALGGDSYSAFATGGSPTSTITLSVDQDAFIKNHDSAKNSAANTKLHVQFETNKIEQVLYRFDVSPIAPAARINSAIGWFFLNAGQSHPEGQVTVHAVTVDWGEMDATWDTLEGAYDIAAVAAIPAKETGGVWVQVNLAGLVQGWVNGVPNYGLLFDSRSEGVHAQYASREDGPHAPYLEVTYGAALVSSVDIEATATLAYGATRTLSRTGVTTYQAPSRFDVQAGPELHDTYVISSSVNSNYGSAPVLEVGDNGAVRYALMDLNLAPIPMGARVVSAQLSLNLESVTTAPGGAELKVHRMLEYWTEDEATYDKTVGSKKWDWPENHDTSSVEVSIPFEAVAPGWFSFDIRPLFAEWASNGAPNYGLVLAGSGGVNNARFTSSDGADPALHPKISISYSCDCNTVCQLPQSSGAVLLVVEKDNDLSPHERAIRAAIESWGYTVSVIAGSAPQNGFDDLVENNDVIFVADSAIDQAEDKLADMTVGVVSMQGDINKEMLLVDKWKASTGSSLNIVDGSHYITQPFYVGDVDIYLANMEGIAVDGNAAPDLQTLANWDGAGGIVVLDKGSESTNGPARGRRVLLPFGRNKDSDFDWSYINQNGLLLMQRSIEWAMGPKLLPGAVAVLMVVDKADDLTDQDIEKSVLIESWGMALTIIEDDAPQLDFDAAMVQADVVFVTEEAKDNEVGDKLTATDLGVVTEEAKLSDELGLSEDIKWEKNERDLTIYNTFYITETLPAGDVEVLSDKQDLVQLDGAIAPDILVMGESDGMTSLAGLEKGSLGINGSVSGRRVILPWGDDHMDFGDLNDNGQTIFRRALEWGAGSAAIITKSLFLSTDSDAILGGLDFTDRDIAEYGDLLDIGTMFFDGSTTTLTKEIDALHILANGDLLLSTKGDTTLGGVNIADGDLAVYDPVNDTAKIAFDGSKRFTDPGEKIISVYVLENGNIVLSTDSDASLGGLSFKEEDLVEYNLETDTATLFFDGSAVGMNREIAAVHVLENGHILLAPKGDATLGGETFEAGDMVDYDPVNDTALLVFDGSDLFAENNEKIMSVHVGAGTGIIVILDTFRDEFNAEVYSGSDGTLNWAGDWQEIGENDGATKGDVRVKGGELQLKDNDKGIEREVDLAGAGGATLKYDFWREKLDDADDYLSVQVSANGAAGPWNEVGRVEGPGNDSSYTAASHDISAYISPNTRIRFMTSPDLDDKDIIWLENVEVSFIP